MDSIRVSKVENVTCTKGISSLTGTVHLTAHHLIFQYDDEKEKELWVPYPLISLVTRLPQTHQGQSPLTLHSRTFETFSLVFSKDSDASDVFESVKELTVTTSVQQLYAFFYSPKPPLPSGGWTIYSPREEFGRMGVGTRTKAWRFTDINKDYSFCPTYPARMIGSITRSSQPMVGITQNRSIQDEKLIEAIFQSHHSPESRAPTANAVANTAKGAGTENMDNYKEGKKVYLGIDHIHTMRESLANVVESLREADTMLASINNDLSEQVSGISVLDRHALRRSGWLRHIAAILEGTVLITRNVHVNSSHVLIHCSDGWDRTSQLSSLAQICLDPFYRTIRGFEILMEKDWLSFGHKFLDRCGHLSSDKFFVSTPENSGGGDGAAQAFLTSVQNRFVSQSHIKETSPVFHQFLESVRQVQRQFPDRFQFNERFLHQLYYHLYSCQFGTFLYNSERERRVADGTGPAPWERTISEMELNTNPSYDPSLDEPSNRTGPADMGVLMPNPKDVRFWHELYGRTDEEMNGRIVAGQVAMPEVVGPVESAADDPVIERSTTPTTVPLPPSPCNSPAQSLAHHAPVPVPDSASRPTPLSRDSFRPFGQSSSSFSLKPTSTSSDPSSRPVAPDYLGGGVRSVWGKLSSNASAAFSVVQEAYVGVAKDFRGNDEKTEELRGRDDLNAWGEQQAPTSTSSAGLPPKSTSENPWAVASSSSAPPSLSPYDNPWGSVRGPSSKERNHTTSPLPLDPTVSPSLRALSDSTFPPADNLSKLSLASTKAADTNKNISPPSSAGSIDPLGVGPI
ncbi:protein-tyrosine phosphatase-like protein [Mucidula mucida]|nr:protein-tyrosine phosphatase-like protein [Mucidula mucida]